VYHLLRCGLEVQAAFDASEADSEAEEGFRDRLERLCRRFAEVARIDFFSSREGGWQPARPWHAWRRRWRNTRRARRAGSPPHRCFLDPEAEIRYADAPEPGEVSFDMRRAEFGHVSNRCSFETMKPKSE